jgi:hypothetical protein
MAACQQELEREQEVQTPATALLQQASQAFDPAAGGNSSRLLGSCCRPQLTAPWLAGWQVQAPALRSCLTPQQQQQQQPPPQQLDARGCMLAAATPTALQGQQQLPSLQATAAPLLLLLLLLQASEVLQRAAQA